MEKTVILKISEDDKRKLKIVSASYKSMKEYITVKVREDYKKIVGK